MANLDLVDPVELARLREDAKRAVALVAENARLQNEAAELRTLRLEAERDALQATNEAIEAEKQRAEAAAEHARLVKLLRADGRRWAVLALEMRTAAELLRRDGKDDAAARVESYANVLANRAEEYDRGVDLPKGVAENARLKEQLAAKSDAVSGKYWTESHGRLAEENARLVKLLAEVEPAIAHAADALGTIVNVAARAAGSSEVEEQRALVAIVATANTACKWADKARALLKGNQQGGAQPT